MTAGANHTVRDHWLASRWQQMRDQLFSGPFNSLLSLAILGFLIWVIPDLFNWLIWEAQFTGESREACGQGGACWVFIKERFGQFMVGFYPADQLWRVYALLGVLGGVALVAIFVPRRRAPALVVALTVGYLVLAGSVLYGGWGGLPVVETAKWGGLLLTLVVSTVGILSALPLGILLALGRRSDLPIIRGLAVGFIELWRGVPLITVLFMASVMIPLFLPESWQLNKLLRLLLGVALFAAAYMAEVVRGGLQAIPGGQYEACDALGLSYWQGMRFIILPQALRHVIPGIVNTFIGLFKDTTLVLVVGMFDLLGIVQAASTDPEWLGFAMEGYIFAGLVFWFFCFGMSRYSLRVERRLKVGGTD
jgi:general L-amino acid transport system permease protein